MALLRDWARQVPLALFAIRLASNRDTGLSPFELVYGRRVVSPLELLHEGWMNNDRIKPECFRVGC